TPFYVIDVTAHECGSRRECELRIAFGECLFCQPALGKIDNDGDQAQGLASLVIKNKAACLYPSDRAIVGADDAKLHNDFALLLEKRLVPTCLELRQILRMRKFTGVVARHFDGAFRQATKGRTTWGQIDKVRTKVDGEATNAGSLAGEFELGIALDQCEFRQLALGDIEIVAENTNGLAGHFMIEGPSRGQDPSNLPVRA